MKMDDKKKISNVIRKVKNMTRRLLQNAKCLGKMVQWWFLNGFFSVGDIYFHLHIFCKHKVSETLKIYLHTFVSKCFLSLRCKHLRVTVDFTKCIFWVYSTCKLLPNHVERCGIYFSHSYDIYIWVQNES